MIQSPAFNSLLGNTFPFFSNRCFANFIIKIRKFFMKRVSKVFGILSHCTFSQKTVIFRLCSAFIWNSLWVITYDSVKMTSKMEVKWDFCTPNLNLVVSYSASKSRKDTAYILFQSRWHSLFRKRKSLQKIYFETIQSLK